MSDLSLIGQKIKIIRRARGISQEMLSESVDMNLRTISRIENGKTLPTIDTLDKIADALSVRLCDFFDEERFENREVIIDNITKIARNMGDKQLKIFYRVIYSFFI